jgi:hypothetical protein
MQKHLHLCFELFLLKNYPPVISYEDTGSLFFLFPFVLVREKRRPHTADLVPARGTDTGTGSARAWTLPRTLSGDLAAIPFAGGRRAHPPTACAFKPSTPRSGDTPMPGGSDGAPMALPLDGGL